MGFYTKLKKQLYQGVCRNDNIFSKGLRVRFTNI